MNCPRMSADSDPRDRGTARLALVVVCLVLIGAGLFLFLKPGSVGLIPGPDADAGSPAATETADAVTGGSGEAAAKHATQPTKQAAGMREQVGGATRLRGRFVSCAGPWPGGGRVGLKRAAPRKGLSSIMDVVTGLGAKTSTRESGKTTATSVAADRRKDEFRTLFGVGKPVAVVDVARDGSFVFEGLPAGKFELALEHPSLRLPSALEVSVSTGQTTDLGALATVEASGLLVIVSDSDGRPVADAKLELHTQMDMSRFSDPRAMMDIVGLMREFIPREARTDERGVHLFGSLPLGRDWQLKVMSKDHAPRIVEVRTAVPGQRVVQVRMNEGASLALSARDKNGNPCAKLGLTLIFPDEPVIVPMQIGMARRQDLGERRKVVTDDAGLVEAKGLPPGRVIVSTRKGAYGYLPQRVELELTDGKRLEHELVLDRGLSIKGRVVDAAGDPIEGAKAMAIPAVDGKILGVDISSLVPTEMWSMGLDRGTEVDDSGRFEIFGFKQGEQAQVLAGADGYTSEKAGPLVAGSKESVITLARAASLAGTVVSDNDSLPLSEFVVTVSRRAFLVLEQTVARQTVKGSTDGSFELAGLPRDKLSVEITSAGRAPLTRSVDFRAGPVDLGELRMGPPAGVAGVAYDPNGHPLAGVNVRVARGGVADNRLVNQMLGGEAATTDASGRFRLEGLPVRRMKLIAEHDDYPPLKSKLIRMKPGVVIDDIELRFGVGGSLKGVIENSKGVRQAKWTVQLKTPDSFDLEIVQSDANGEFLVKGLLPGTYQIEAFPSDYMQKMVESSASLSFATKPQGRGVEFDFGKLMGQAMSMMVRKKVEIRDREQTEVKLIAEQKQEVSGRLELSGAVRVGGRPLATGVIALVPAGAEIGGLVGQIRDGHYKVAGVVPGTYRAQVSTGLLGAVVGRPDLIVVPKGKSLVHDIDLPGGRIAGVVVDEEGTPVSGVILTIVSPGDESRGSARADIGEGNAVSGSSGEFRFDGLAPGTYEVFAKELIFGSGRSGRLDPIELSNGQVVEGQELRLVEGATIAATVRDANGPRANALVLVLQAQGRPVSFFHRSLTDSDGEVEISGLPPGVYRLSVDAPGAAAAVTDEVTVRTDGTARVDVVLEKGVPVRLVVSGDSSRVKGGELVRYYIAKDGALVRSGMVTLPPLPKGKQSRVLELGNLAPGEYELRIESPSLGVLREKRSVTGGRAAEWKLEVK